MGNNPINLIDPDGGCTCPEQTLPVLDLFTLPTSKELSYAFGESFTTTFIPKLQGYLNNINPNAGNFDPISLAVDINMMVQDVNYFNFYDLENKTILIEGQNELDSGLKLELTRVRIDVYDDKGWSILSSQVDIMEPFYSYDEATGSFKIMQRKKAQYGFLEPGSTLAPGVLDSNGNVRGTLSIDLNTMQIRQLNGPAEPTFTNELNLLLHFQIIHYHGD
jgi:hypothetical protein